jgi:hypothetical protein
MNHLQADIERATNSDRYVANMARHISALPRSRLREHLLQAQRARVTHLTGADAPFLPAEDGAGEIALFPDQRSGKMLHLPSVALCGHAVIPGSTGTGKTSVVAHITKSVGEQRPDVLVSYFDPKEDWRKRALDDQRCIIITPSIPLNILRHPSCLTRDDYHALLLDTFARSHWAGYHQARTLRLALERAYQQSADPSIQDVVAQLKRFLSKEFTYAERDAAGNVDHKLTEFQRLTPGIYQAKGRCLTMDDLARVPVYWPMLPGDTYEFLFTLWLLVRYHHNRATGVRNRLHSLVVVDESLQIFSEHTSHMEGSALLDRAVSTMREMGISLFLTASSRRTLTPLVKANATLQIATATTDGAEADDIRRTFQLTDSEFDYYRRMKPLEVIMHYPTRWPNNVLGIVQPFTAEEKLVDERDWTRAAHERQQALLPPTSAPIIIKPDSRLAASETAPDGVPPAPGTTSDEMGSTPVATTDASRRPSADGLSPTTPAIVTIRDTTSPEAGTTTAPPGTNANGPAEAKTVATTSGSVDVPPVSLSTPEEALLNVVGPEVIITSTPAYRRANLSLAAGDAAAKHTAALGLMTRSPIIARPGRGGAAIALELTSLGYERIKMTPPHRTRGGDSAQHRYLVHHLARHIKGAMVEATLGGQGGKSIDLLVRVTDEHERLLAAIAHNAHYLSMEHHDIAPGDLVAIEIEVSSPGKTAAKNIMSNHEHGVTTTIIATMPKTIDAAQRAISNTVTKALLPHVIILDALDLLEALRKGRTA